MVLESCHVGKHAKTYADNDKMAAARIALVYLAGNAPCVWVPDERSRQRRELLHAYRKAVADHTAASNSLRAYLNGNAIRLAKAQPRVGEHPAMDPPTTRLVAPAERDPRRALRRSAMPAKSAASASTGSSLPKSAPSR